MTHTELRRLARLGAEVRLEDLRREMAAIYAAFPDLQSSRAASARNPYTAGVRGGVTGVPSALAGAVTRRRKLSRAARQRIAAAQRKRWAEWRAKNRKPADEAPTATDHVPSNAAGGSRKKR